jgi:hypothetical protein
MSNEFVFSKNNWDSQKNEFLHLPLFGFFQILDSKVGRENNRKMEAVKMVYNLRRRSDKQLECLANTFPQDILYLIALIHHCLPKHRYRLRKRNSS